ncbi:hypothetical protein PR048_007543, partial [Dryococelus australis]
MGPRWLERFGRSPPTNPNRVQSPAGSPDFRKWESCRTMPLVGGSSQGSLVSPAPPFWRRSILTSITLIVSQDLAVKSRPTLFISTLVDTNEGEAKRVWGSAGMQRPGKREITEKTRRQAASFRTIPTCENPGATLLGTEPGSPRWKASGLTTTPLQHFSWQEISKHELLTLSNPFIQRFHMFARSILVCECQGTMQELQGDNALCKRRLAAHARLPGPPPPCNPARLELRRTLILPSVVFDLGPRPTCLAPLQPKLGRRDASTGFQSTSKAERYDDSLSCHGALHEDVWWAAVEIGGSRGADDGVVWNRGETGDPRGDPLTSGIVRHDSQVRTTPRRIKLCSPWYRRFTVKGAMVMQWSDNSLPGGVALMFRRGKHCSPPTKADRVQYPVGSLSDFRKWESCRTIPLVGGFTWGTPVSPFPCIPALLHSHLASLTLALKTSLLRSALISRFSIIFRQGGSGLVESSVQLYHMTCSKCCGVGAGATAAERLARSPPTKAIRAQSPAGSRPDFRMGHVLDDAVGFSGISSSPSPPISFRCCSILTSITLFGSQYLDAKSRRSLFTRYVSHTQKCQSLKWTVLDNVLFH